MEQLNVLVVESEAHAGDPAREALGKAGHTVLRCHEAGVPAFPCNGLIEGKGCPFDNAIVDVVLDVRPHRRAQPAPLEDGVSCALKAHVPVVVAGSAWLNPYGEYASNFVASDADDVTIVDACEHAANAVLRDHSAIAARALRDTLDRRDISASPLVAVRRRKGVLVVDVATKTVVAREAQSMAAVRITAALRKFDRDAKGIDVVFHTT
jgi:hypothetical protein